MKLATSDGNSTRDGHQNFTFPEKRVVAAPTARFLFSYSSSRIPSRVAGEYQKRESSL